MKKEENNKLSEEKVCDEEYIGDHPVTPLQPCHTEALKKKKKKRVRVCLRGGQPVNQPATGKKESGFQLYLFPVSPRKDENEMKFTLIDLNRYKKLFVGLFSA